MQKNIWDPKKCIQTLFFDWIFFYYWSKGFLIENILFLLKWYFLGLNNKDTNILPIIWPKYKKYDFIQKHYF